MAAEQALLDIVNRLAQGQETMNRQLEQQNQALGQQAQLIEIERARVQALTEQLGQQSQSSRSGSVFDTRGIGRSTNERPCSSSRRTLRG